MLKAVRLISFAGVNSSPSSHPLQVLVATCGAWWLPHTARAFANRGALAGLWMTMGNHTKVPHYRRCWPFQLLMWPLYYGASQTWVEHAFYSFFPVWKAWLKRQSFPQCNVIHAMMGYATEMFDVADRTGALKVVDCQNSHPTSYYGYWQRECDLWCPGDKVPIPQWMFARMNRELERADLILCPSNFVRDTMAQNGIASEKCFVNPFGVDLALFQPRVKIPEKPRFICVGNICVRKGHQYLFRAFAQLKSRLPEAELICVGEYRSDFRRERPRWEGTFTYYPGMSHDQLAKLLPTCTAFVLASVEEGFARVLSEAMGSGLPIIATPETGATTLVSDGVEGLIVPARRPGELAEAMLRAAADRILNKTMGHAAYHKGAKGNTWQHFGDRLLSKYTARLKACRGAEPLQSKCS